MKFDSMKHQITKKRGEKLCTHSDILSKAFFLYSKDITSPRLLTPLMFYYMNRKFLVIGYPYLTLLRFVMTLLKLFPFLFLSFTDFKDELEWNHSTQKKNLFTLIYSNHP